MTAAVSSTGSRFADEAMAVAYRALLRDAKPVPVADLAAELGCEVSEVAETIDVLERKGRVRRDDEGRILASEGLSVVPTEHAVSLGDRTVWTWCAKVALGVAGTAGPEGRIESRCAETERPVRLDFEGGRPASSDVAVFWPSSDFTSSCQSAVEDLCPNINFFESSSAATAWMSTRNVPGEVLSVEEATERAVRWATELTLLAGDERPG